MIVERPPAAARPSARFTQRETLMHLVIGPARRTRAVYSEVIDLFAWARDDPPGQPRQRTPVRAAGGPDLAQLRPRLGAVRAAERRARAEVKWLESHWPPARRPTDSRLTRATVT